MTPRAVAQTAESGYRRSPRTSSPFYKLLLLLPMCLPTIFSYTLGSEQRFTVIYLVFNTPPHVVCFAFPTACLAEHTQCTVFCSQEDRFLSNLCTQFCRAPCSEEGFKMCASSASPQKAAGNRVGNINMAVHAIGTQTLHVTNGWHSSKPTKTSCCPCYGQHLTPLPLGACTT